MRKLRKAIGAVIMAVIVTALAGCGSKVTPATMDTGADAGSGKEAGGGAAEDAGSSGSGKVTIRFSWWGGDSRHEATQNAVAKFMELHPEIEVKNEFGVWTGWEDSMATAFYAKTAPDVNQINWNWIESFSGDGSAFLDLNTVSDALDLTQFDQAYLDLCTASDKLQAVPVAMTGRIFYWNKTTFEKAGLSVPASLSDLMAAGEVFREKLGEDYYPIALGEYDRMILMVYYLESVYGKNWVENGALNYTQEEIEAGLSFIQSLEDAHVTPTVQSILGDGAESLDKNPKWISGKYAGIFEWDSAATKFQGALEEGQEFVVGDYFKDMGTNQGGFSKVSLAFAISENTAHPKESAMLVQFLLNEAEGVEQMGSERGVPLSKAGLSLCTEKNLLDPIVAEANGKVLAWTDYQLDSKFEAAELKSSDGVYYDVMAGLSYKDYDIPKAAEKLIEGINAVLEK